MKGKFDFKSFLVNHFEKIGVGVIGLLSVAALGTAQWGSNSQTDGELQNIVSTTRSTIESSSWPDDERTAIEDTPDVIRLAGLMSSQTANRDKYGFSAEWRRPLLASREKRGAVEVLPAEAPVIDWVLVPLALVPDEDEDDSEMLASAEGEDDPDGDEEELTDEQKALAARYGTAKSPGGGNQGGGGASRYPGMSGPGLPGSGFPGSGFPGGGRPGLPGSGGGRPGGPGFPGAPGGGLPGGEPDGLSGGGDYDGGLSGGMGLPGMGTSDGYGGGYDGGYGAMMSSQAQKKVELRGGLSVRYVVDLRKQRKALADALRIPTGSTELNALVSYFDLHVERMEEHPSSGEWSDWMPVPNEDLVDVFTETLGQDPDIVNPLITRGSITMPLPRRAGGKWLPAEVSHPQIEAFELDDDERELFNEFNKRMMDKYREKQAEMPPSRKRSKGFSSYISDLSDIRSGLASSYGSSEKMMDDLSDSFGEGKEGGLTDDQKKTLMLDPESQSAADRRLLVRFIDFSAERGRRYRYRVRLEMNNPNFGLPIAELETPDLGDAPTLMSDWSSATDPMAVPREYRYYVDDVRSRPGSYEVVGTSVYMENKEAGTPVKGDVRVGMGLPFGGSTAVDVIDMAVNALERRDVTLKTRDVLCAAVETDKMSEGDHPDIRAALRRMPKGMKLVPDFAVSLNDDNRMVLRASGDMAEREKSDDDEIAFLLSNYEVWKVQKTRAADGFPGFGGYDGGEGGYGGGLGMGSGNPLGGMPGMGLPGSGMPGMGMPGSGMPSMGRPGMGSPGAGGRGRGR